MEKTTYRCNKDDIDINHLVEIIIKGFKKKRIYELTGSHSGIDSYVEKTYYDTSDMQIFNQHGVCRKVVYNANDEKSKFALLQYTPSMNYSLESYELGAEDLSSDEICKILEVDQEMNPVVFLKSKEKHLFFNDKKGIMEPSLNDALVECVVKAVKVYNSKKEYVNNCVLIQLRDRSLDVQNETIKEENQERVLRCYNAFEAMMIGYRNEKVTRSMNSFIKQLVVYPKRIVDLQDEEEKC